MKTATYSNAVTAIREYSEKKQAELDAAAAAARQSNIVATRAAALEGVDPASPAYPVCVLVAQTLTIGREDGYPSMIWPGETKAAVLAAVRAGVLSSVGNIGLYLDSGSPDTNGVEHTADYHAWDNAKTYRSRQQWKNL